MVFVDVDFSFKYIIVLHRAVLAPSLLISKITSKGHMTMGRTHGGQLLQISVNATGLVMVAHRLPSTPASSLAGS